MPRALCRTCLCNLFRSDSQRPERTAEPVTLHQQSGAELRDTRVCFQNASTAPFRDISVRKRMADISASEVAS
jgi:hypothetical protein